MKQLLIIILCLWSIAYGQSVGQLRYDTTKILKVGGYNELKIQNSTMGVTGGVLTNVDGNGWGKWVMPSSGGTIYNIKTTGGADTTGLVNVSSIIQAAITAGYKNIYAPTGTYLCSAITLLDGVTIFGDGRGQSIFKTTSNAPIFKCSLASGGNNTTFRDIGLLGTFSGGATTAQVGINSDSAQKILITNISAVNMGGYAVNINYNGGPSGYPANAGKSNTVTNSYFEGCYGGVIFNQRAEYNSVTNCTFTNCSYGIYNLGGNNRINGNSVENCYYGIYMDYFSNSGHGVCTGNTVNHNAINLSLHNLSIGFSFTNNDFLTRNIGTHGLIELVSCADITFDGGMMLAGDTVRTTLCTNITLNNVIFWGGDPIFNVVSGQAPTVFRVGRGGVNTISLLDVTNTGTLSFTGAPTGSRVWTFGDFSATAARIDAAQTFTGVQSMTSPDITTSITTPSVTFSIANTTATTGNIFGAATALTIGGTPTTAITHNYSTNATAAATTKTINFGTGGAPSSTTNINIGSANGGTTTINSPTTAGTIFNAATGFRIGGAATSRKMLVGNGTNFVASTETWATPGTSGNVLTSDGTNWTSAAPSTFALTNGNGTTASGTAVDLGGTATGNVTINMSGNVFEVSSVVQAFLKYDNSTYYKISIDGADIAGNVQFSTYGAGALTTDGSGNITAVSDASYKDILGTSTTGLDAILQLHPKVFKWNKISGYNMNDVNTGFVAQDVKKLIPNSTGYTKDGHLTLIDRPILAANTVAIQELYQMIVRQQKEIDDLKLQLKNK